MTSLRRILLTGAGALVLSASLLLAAGCKAKAAAKSQPQPFTATLTELDGVQAVYTFRHPKLIADDLKKPTVDVPEAAMLQMFLGQLAPYGYPSFTEIAPGSNIGVVMLKLDPAELKSRAPEFVAFARLKEGGKIQAALEQNGLVFQKHGDWTWIARKASTFEKIKNADALAAFIDRPQTADLRAWGRVSPDLLASAKDHLLPKIKEKLASLPADKQKAILGYFDVAWSYLAQLHSVGGSLSFGDQGIELTESAQFLPDSSIGTLLRYTPPASYPKIAQAIPVDDALFSGVARENVDAMTGFTDSLWDSLLAVDYPPAAELLKEAKAGFLTFTTNSDGGWVTRMSMFTLGDPKQPQGASSSFTVATGHFTAEQARAYYKSSIGLTQKYLGAMAAITTEMAPKGIRNTFDFGQFKENALVIDGINFDSITMASKVAVAGKEKTATTVVYYGVSGGNMVCGTEAELRKNLPALIGGQPVPDAVLAANAVVAPDEFVRMDVHGGAIVDIALKNAKVDASDSDTKEQIKAIKDGFAEAGPISVKISAAQAQAIATIFIPYKFIEQGIRLGQFVSTLKSSHEQPAENTAPAPASTPAPVAP